MASGLLRCVETVVTNPYNFDRKASNITLRHMSLRHEIEHTLSCFSDSFKETLPSTLISNRASRRYSLKHLNGKEKEPGMRRGRLAVVLHPPPKELTREKGLSGPRRLSGGSICFPTALNRTPQTVLGADSPSRPDHKRMSQSSQPENCYLGEKRKHTHFDNCIQLSRFPRWERWRWNSMVKSPTNCRCLNIGCFP